MKKLKFEILVQDPLKVGDHGPFWGLRPTRWSNLILAGKSDRYQYFGGKLVLVSFDTKKRENRENLEKHVIWSHHEKCIFHAPKVYNHGTVTSWVFSDLKEEGKQEECSHTPPQVHIHA
jgi:hypothetical protein